MLAYALLVGLVRDIMASDLLFGVAALLLFSVPFMLISLVHAALLSHRTTCEAGTSDPRAGLDLKAYLGNPQRMANGLPMFLLFVGFGHIFVEFKGSIYLLNGFKWDADLRRARDAACISARSRGNGCSPLLGFPIITFLINVVYNMWFFVMWMSWIYFGFAAQGSELRTRFFLTYFITWIVGGSAMAIWLSSAGPAYYGRLVGGADPFAGLMSYLHAANTVLPIWAVDLQEVLWQGHLSNGMLGEISAMPSMHNGTALLFMLAAYRVSRLWGHIMAANALLILIGSMHLGWHYAIDGYVAWVLCYVVWLAAAPMARWWHGSGRRAEFDARTREAAT